MDPEESQDDSHMMSEDELEDDVEEIEEDVEEVEDVDEVDEVDEDDAEDGEDAEDEEVEDEEESEDEDIDEEDDETSGVVSSVSLQRIPSRSSTPSEKGIDSGTATPERRPRGRPPSTTPKKKPGRKPRPPEEKERIKLERKKKKAEERLQKRKAKADAKAAAKAAAKLTRRSRGPRKLTEDEKKSREEARKAKYEELKRKKAEMAEKRRIKNEELREKRKKKKEEEQKQREAYEKRMQVLKASFLDETSQMSGDGAPIMDDDNSQSSLTQGSSKNRTYGAPGANEMSNLAPIKSVTAANLLEYRWPLEGKDSEYYFLQEQVSEYLDIKSFKRRYPDLTRRNVFNEERDFLVEMGVVTVTQADLGLTAIPSAQILDIMSNDFYEKYEEFRTVVVERKDRTLRQTNYSLANVESHQMADFVKKAMKSVAEWNKQMNQERKEKRSAYFDMQTNSIHYPMTGKGNMKVIKKPKLGHYPIALIPGQFVDHYQKLTSNQLKYLPLNTALRAPPTKERLQDLASEGSDTDSSDCSTCSSDSDEEEEPKKEVDVKLAPEKPKRAIDADIPGAACKICSGDRKRNKDLVPEKLLHCSKCEASCHPTCAGLCLDLLQYVTSYKWECTECKGCSKCHDHSDEDKMLFCDLCDRGYHIYCVGLDSIPSGRWHCSECAKCSSCDAKTADGGVETDTDVKWAFEFKTGSSGDKIFSHSMCHPCHRLWKRAMFCPECNVCFGREKCDSLKNYYFCWVCSRQHHANCVGQERFICSACQRKTLDKRLGAGNQASSMGIGEYSSSRSQFGRGTRRSNINYANFA